MAGAQFGRWTSLARRLSSSDRSAHCGIRWLIPIDAAAGPRLDHGSSQPMCEQTDGRAAAESLSAARPEER